jgi:hypothetical protein
LPQEVAMRPARIIATLVCTAALAVTGCTARATQQTASPLPADPPSVTSADPTARLRWLAPPGTKKPPSQPPERQGRLSDVHRDRLPAFSAAGRLASSASAVQPISLSLRQALEPNRYPAACGSTLRHRSGEAAGPGSRSGPAAAGGGRQGEPGRSAAVPGRRPALRSPRSPSCDRARHPAPAPDR